MENAPRYGLGLLALLLLAAPLLALQFNVTVTNEIGTRLPGTHVQILQANTVLYEGTTIWCPSIDAKKGCPKINDQAMAGFELAPGTYFLRLQRDGYADHVYLQTLNKDTSLTLIMFIHKSVYTVYGRVSNASEGMSGLEVKLVGDNDAVVRSTPVRDNGYFLMDSLWPGTNYYLRVDEGSQRLLSAPFSHADVGAYYLELSSPQTPMRNVTQLPTLTGPNQADLYSRIKVNLMVGDRGMEGQVVRVLTPNGEFNLTTDGNGSAKVQAAEGGRYQFMWSGLSVNVSVPMPPKPAVVPAPVVIAPAPVFNVSNPPEPAAPAAPAVDQTMALGAVSLVVIGAGVLVILALLIIFGPKVLRKMQGNQKDGETYAQVPFEHSPETSLSETTAMAESTSHNAAPVHKKHAAKHPAHHAKHPAHKKK